MPFSLAQAMKDAESIKGARLNNQARQFQMDEALGAKDKDRAFQEAAREAVGDDGMYDVDKHAKALEKMGYPDKAQEVRDRALKSVTDMRATFEQTLPYINENTWGQLRSQYNQALGGAMPEQYDPEWVDALHKRILKVQGKLQQYGAPRVIEGTDVLAQREESTGRESVIGYTGPYGTGRSQPARPPSAGRGGGGAGGAGGTALERVAAAIRKTREAQGYQMTEEAALREARRLMTAKDSNDTQTAQQAARILVGLANSFNPEGGRQMLEDALGPDWQSRISQAPPAGQDQPPPRALQSLKEGQPTQFRNGQVWTLQNGQPVRLR